MVKSCGKMLTILEGNLGLNLTWIHSIAIHKLPGVCLESMFVINPQYYSLKLLLLLFNVGNKKHNGWKIIVTCVPHV